MGGVGGRESPQDDFDKLTVRSIGERIVQAVAASMPSRSYQRACCNHVFSCFSASSGISSDPARALFAGLDLESEQDGGLGVQGRDRRGGHDVCPAFNLLSGSIFCDQSGRKPIAHEHKTKQPVFIAPTAPVRAGRMMFSPSCVREGGRVCLASPATPAHAAGAPGRRRGRDGAFPKLCLKPPARTDVHGFTSAVALISATG